VNWNPPAVGRDERKGRDEGGKGTGLLGGMGVEKLEPCPRVDKSRGKEEVEPSEIFRQGEKKTGPCRKKRGKAEIFGFGSEARGGFEAGE